MDNPIRLFFTSIPIIFAFGLCFCLSIDPFIILAAEQDNPGDQVKQIETDLLRQKEQFLRYDSQERGLLDQLSSIESVIAEKRRLIKELMGKINENKNALRTKQHGLAEVEHSILELEELLRKRLVALYKYAKRGYLQSLASANDLDQLNKRMKYLEVIVDNDQGVMTELARARTVYRRDLVEIEKQLAIITKMEEVEREGLASIKEDLERKVIVLAKIHQEKEFHKTAVDELESAAKNLKDTVLNLDQVGSSNVKLPKGFEKRKGKLPLPYDGKILTDSKELGIEAFSSQKGIYISGPLGAEVKAVFPGRVDFSGQLKGYGEVIVINHGSRFFTISAYLLRRDKEEGEKVSEGEVIGKMGRTGLLTGPGLYFEIREGGIPLEPIDWLEVH
ncbi:MAG: peptidoglycan DD-metalloendopeptidase family protein [Deltaproteobacteria bacterium]|nr:peptidoglycan DD-metalloendopeptidase family protein [Deltaproteobacteria bacterium]